MWNVSVSPWSETDDQGWNRSPSRIRSGTSCCWMWFAHLRLTLSSIRDVRRSFSGRVSGWCVLVMDLGHKWLLRDGALWLRLYLLDQVKFDLCWLSMLSSGLFKHTFSSPRAQSDAPLHFRGGGCRPAAGWLQDLPADSFRCLPLLWFPVKLPSTSVVHFLPANESLLREGLARVIGQLVFTFRETRDCFPLWSITERLRNLYNWHF